MPLAKSPTTVLHVTFDMGIGGTEQVIKNLIQSSRSTELHHEIVCLEGPVGPWASELEQAGITVHQLQRQPKLTVSVIRQLRTIIKRQRIDIVHTHQYTPFVYGFLASRFTSAKLIFTEHGRFYPDIVSSKRRLINRLVFPFVDAVTAISHATKQALVEHEGIPERQISVIYNGIEPVPESLPAALQTLREKHRLPERTIIVGTVARLDTIKNQGYMIREFAKAHQTHPELRLVIVGDGPERQQHEHLIDKLNLGDAVVLTGFIAKPVDYINLFDVFLLPSLSEGTSMTLLEAMSAGKPSIVSNVGGNPEIISEAFLGAVIDNEVDALAAQITAYAETPIGPQDCDKIRSWYQTHYATHVFSAAFINLYNQLLTNKGRHYDTRTQ